MNAKISVVMCVEVIIYLLSHFSMIESKLWHSKTEIKNVKVVKIVDFIKTCYQYPHKFW